MQIPLLCLFVFFPEKADFTTKTITKDKGKCFIILKQQIHFCFTLSGRPAQYHLFPGRHPEISSQTSDLFCGQCHPLWPVSRRWVHCYGCVQGGPILVPTLKGGGGLWILLYSSEWKLLKDKQISLVNNNHFSL